jgi:hypothetical protein
MDVASGRGRQVTQNFYTVTLWRTSEVAKSSLDTAVTEPFRFRFTNIPDHPRHQSQQAAAHHSPLCRPGGPTRLASRCYCRVAADSAHSESMFAGDHVSTSSLACATLGLDAVARLGRAT